MSLYYSERRAKRRPLKKSRVIVVRNIGNPIEEFSVASVIPIEIPSIIYLRFPIQKEDFENRRATPREQPSQIIQPYTMRVIRIVLFAVLGTSAASAFSAFSAARLGTRTFGATALMGRSRVRRTMGTAQFERWTRAPGQADCVRRAHGRRGVHGALQRQDRHRSLHPRILRRRRPLPHDYECRRAAMSSAVPAVAAAPPASVRVRGRSEEGMKGRQECARKRERERERRERERKDLGCEKWRCGLES